jgi:hypothetical protein
VVRKVTVLSGGITSNGQRRRVRKGKLKKGKHLPCVIHLTQEFLYARDVREVGLRQQAQSRDEIASSESLAG